MDAKDIGSLVEAAAKICELASIAETQACQIIQLQADIMALKSHTKIEVPPMDIFGIFRKSKPE